jgi:hypothetical protein
VTNLRLRLLILTLLSLGAGVSLIYEGVRKLSGNTPPTWVGPVAGLLMLVAFFVGRPLPAMLKKLTNSQDSE